MPIYNINSIHQYLKTQTGKKVVFTNGCFDLLHPGHIQYLTQAKALGDCLIVGLNSDQSIQTIKGSGRPICNQQFRATMVDALKPVDAVVIFEESTPMALISIIKPHIHVKGGDYQVTSLPEYDTVIQYGGQVQCLSFLDGYSTTSLIERIQSIH